MEVVVIGGGAAGFFAAISCKSHFPHAQVSLFEKSDKILAKVKISGGGRCNVTHSSFDVKQLATHYPRGERYLKKAFGLFNPSHTVAWFKERGVPLKTEDDGRMFPVTDNSQTIIDCLLNEAQKLGVQIKMKTPVKAIQKENDKFRIVIGNSDAKLADNVIVATGGSPRPAGFKWLQDLGHSVEEPVPSLFTFNMPGEEIKKLMGVSVNQVEVRIMGEKLKSSGPLLITHWGMSGPAILKLSAFGARLLSAKKYNFSILVNWTGNLREEEVKSMLMRTARDYPQKKISNMNPLGLPGRLWEFLLQKTGLDTDMMWVNPGSKWLNRLAHTLCNDVYQVDGKTTFKEEFVTCGGVSLKEVDMKTMQSKILPGLYFAGEVLDVDGITGGFNFQAAWTTGYLAGKLNSGV